MTEIDWEELKSFITSRELDLHYIETSERYRVMASDGYLFFFCFILKSNDDEKNDFENNYKDDANKKIGNYYSREPFATKTLKDGSKLYRRKHGKKETILANNEKEIIFEVPYAKAKINKLEVIDANTRDRIDLIVKSPSDSTLAGSYGMPTNYLLNQFGFDVVVSDLLYSDKSEIYRVWA